MTPWLILAQQGPGAGEVAGGLLAWGVMFLIWAVVTVGGLALLIFALVDAIKNPNLTDTERIV